MFGVITSRTYADDINTAIEQSPLFYKEGEFTEEEFIQNCKSASLVDIKEFIIDIDSCTNGNTIIKGIRHIKMTRPKTRIILIAVDREPGDHILSEAVSLSVYDIISPAIPEIPKGTDLIEFDLSPLIIQRLENPGTYADVVRYHMFSEPTKSNSSKEKKEKSSTIKLEKEVIIQKEVIHVPKNTVAIINMSNQAGSSFITLNLAAAFSKYNVSISISEHPTYREGKPFLFDILGLTQRKYNEKPFYSVPHMIKNHEKIKREKLFEYNGIQWLIQDTEQKRIVEWTYEDFLKYLYIPKSTVNLLDIGKFDVENNRNETIKIILSEVDFVFLIIDPLLYALDANIKMYSFIQELIKQDVNIHLIFNKWNSGVDFKLLKEIFPTLKKSVKIPFIDFNLLYGAYYNSKFPYNVKEINEIIEQPMQQLMKTIIPEMTFPKKGKKNLFGLFKR